MKEFERLNTKKMDQLKPETDKRDDMLCKSKALVLSRRVTIDTKRLCWSKKKNKLKIY